MYDHYDFNQIVNAIDPILRAIGEDPEREGLLATPERIAKAWLETWASGYNQDPEDVLTTFYDGGEHYDEMVLVRDIWFYSHCEHHMAPFFGHAHIAYIPDRKIVGLSKLPRLLDIYARRLQVQERLTNQVATAIMEHLNPKGVAVKIQARHLCMESRGVQKPGCVTTTTKLLGVFLKDAKARNEFLQEVK